MIGDADWEENFWYDDQIGKYNYNTGEVSDDVDGEFKGFAQLVWDETTEVGCGKVRFDDEDLGEEVEFAVCRYASPGNTEDEYTDHIQCPLNGGEPDCDA